MTELQPQKESARRGWLAARKGHIGGSEIGTITGSNPYGCARALWYEKVGVPASREFEETPVMRRGTILEPVAAKEFASKHLRPLWEMKKVAETQKMIEHLSQKAPLPWMGGTPDYFLYEMKKARQGKHTYIDMGRPDEILEIKTANKWAFSQAKKIGGQPYHHDQVLWYLMLMGLKNGKLFYLWPDGWESFKVDITLTEVECQRLRSESRLFWVAVNDGRQKWITKGFAPEAMEPSLESLSRLPTNDKRCHSCSWAPICQVRGLEEVESGPEPIDLSGDSDWNSAAAAYLAAQADADIAKSRLQDARSLLEEKMGNESLAQGGGIRVSWKTSVRSSLDGSALRRDHPEIASKYTKETPIRSFRATKQ